MKKLGEDPVPNIRFNFAKTSALIYHKLPNSSKMDCSGQLKKMSDNDADFDAKFYASKALSEIKAI